MAKAPDDAPKRGEVGRGRGNRSDNVTSKGRGNGDGYLAARLKRDHPAIAARVAIGAAIEKAKATMAKAPDDAPKRGEVGRGRESRSDNVRSNKGGNDMNRLAAKLKRDHPAIAARVANGAAIEKAKATMAKARELPQRTIGISAETAVEMAKGAEKPMQPSPGPGRGRKTSVNNTRFTDQRGSTNSSYLAARLKRDHPAIAARMAIGVAIEAELGNRQGQRTDLTEPPENFPEVSGKETRQIAAEKAGFGNAETYRQTGTPNPAPCAALPALTLTYWPVSSLANCQPMRRRCRQVSASR